MLVMVLFLFPFTFATKDKGKMNIYFLLFALLIPLATFGGDFKICRIHSPNPLYEYLANQHLQRKRNDVVTISLKDSLAFVSYRGEKGRVVFRRCQKSSNTYCKRKYGLTAYLMLGNNEDVTKTARVVIWKNIRRNPRLSVDLKQVGL